ncbi:hypothetical protein [Pontibacter ramchanderi]|uniref:SH3 domain-containing protein n=1 Tax=Pontibacter ramchanderi TaxID=1179743 RepID=A0A2N3UC71_9BACT|nr:hypothetical protein [Pontibacter ramchanderi]PKV66941.1 hypothetical protein BD749_2079 [Pontibacter ramchanderi]
MKTTLTVCLLALFASLAACNSEKRSTEVDGSEATVASETGQLPADVLYATRPLIGGEVYRTASFQASSLLHFDTTQLIQVLDTTDAVFVKARVHRDTAAYTGFVSKAILPE